MTYYLGVLDVVTGCFAGIRHGNAACFTLVRKLSSLTFIRGPTRLTSLFYFTTSLFPLLLSPFTGNVIINIQVKLSPEKYGLILRKEKFCIKYQRCAGTIGTCPCSRDNITFTGNSLELVAESTLL